MLTAVAFGQEVEGFTELRLTAYTGVQAEVPLFVVERFRPTFTAPFGERFSLSTTIEAGLSQGWRTNDALIDLAADAGVDPAITSAFGQAHANEVLSISNAGNYLAVDRLYVDYYSDKVDVRLGRQALNWGSAFVVNPTDPFPEVLLTEPWKPRSGVNALKVAVPLGDLDSLNVVVASDDAFLFPRVAARATVNLLQADWSLVAAYRDDAEDAVLGLDVKGTLGVGYWFEGIARFRREASPVEELAAGVDYSVPVGDQQLVVTAQYYRNGAGSTGGEQPLGLLREREPFASTFSGRDYVMASVSGGLTNDVSVSALWMQNLNDGTAFVVPSVQVVAGGQWDVSAAAQIPVSLTGDGGEFKPSADALRVELPGADGSPKTVDFGGVSPSATFIVWTRFNF